MHLILAVFLAHIYSMSANTYHDYLQLDQLDVTVMQSLANL